MYRKEWIIDPKEIGSLSGKDDLVCLIGTESEPKIGIECLNKDGEYTVTAKSKDGYVYLTIKANSYNVESVINEMVDLLVEEYSRDWGCDDDNSTEEYFCDNVFCDMCGVIVKPNLNNANGDAVCTSCGEPLINADDIEYANTEDDGVISYKDLAATVLEILFDNCVIWGMNKDDILDELYEYNINEDEINELVKYHDIRMSEEYDLDYEDE